MHMHTCPRTNALSLTRAQARALTTPPSTTAHAHTHNTHARAHTGPAEARFADDVWISGLLARWGIPRIVVPLLPSPLADEEAVDRGDTRTGIHTGTGTHSQIDTGTDTHRHTRKHETRQPAHTETGLSLEYMFGQVWRQVGSQQRALKGHPQRAARNHATVLFFSDFWGRLTD